ncbi:MAG: aromatic amino acid transport family protein [Patescibacteria group bacterium]|jgi:amino acid permease
MRSEKQVFLHRGIYKPSATLSEAVFMITGMTIGAGVLAIPYAVAQVGLLTGIAYIAALGLIIMFLNLMIGEIASRTKEPMQLAGFAGKYLGSWAKYFLSFIFLFSAFGTLLVYVIGEGTSLAAVFGGSPTLWSVVFWSVGSFLIWGGLKRIKSIDKLFGIIIMGIITGLSLYLLPRFNFAELSYFDGSQIFFPLGVILFALHASPAISEAHALLPNRARDFRRALILGTIIPILLYIIFTIAVVGFTGAETSEIATIGLGVALGPFIGVMANVFAVLAMSTGFIGLGTALRETLSWDLKVPDKGSLFLVVSVPLILFLFGIRSFISVLDVVGTVGIAFEGIIMGWVYLRARKGSDALPESYLSPRHPLLISFPVIAFFGSLLLFSFYRFFVK